jgi:hypothetical protein
LADETMNHKVLRVLLGGGSWLLLRRQPRLAAREDVLSRDLRGYFCKRINLGCFPYRQVARTCHLAVSLISEWDSFAVKIIRIAM